MDVEEDTVDILPDVSGTSGVYAEMSVGSHNYPWPEFVKGTIENVNKKLSGSGIVAKAVL